MKKVETEFWNLEVQGTDVTRLQTRESLKTLPETTKADISLLKGKMWQGHTLKDLPEALGSRLEPSLDVPVVKKAMWSGSLSMCLAHQYADPAPTSLGSRLEPSLDVPVVKKAMWSGSLSMCLAHQYADPAPTCSKLGYPSVDPFKGRQCFLIPYPISSALRRLISASTESTNPCSALRPLIGLAAAATELSPTSYPEQ
nr:hypothetical protein [Tanacetum cinerariifolium]